MKGSHKIYFIYMFQSFKIFLDNKYLLLMTFLVPYGLKYATLFSELQTNFTQNSMCFIFFLHKYIVENNWKGSICFHIKGIQYTVYSVNYSWYKEYSIFSYLNLRTILPIFLNEFASHQSILWHSRPFYFTYFH